MYMGYESLKRLGKILKDEKTFQIQIFTLETLDLFEYFLNYRKVEYKKTFVSKYDINCKYICILLKDTKNYEVGCNSRVILFSNERDRRFVPYKFVLTQKEKEKLIEKRLEAKKELDYEKQKDVGLMEKFEQNKNLSYCSLNRCKIDVGLFLTNALTYLECVIVFCLVRESKLDKIFNEIKCIDDSLSNKFVIKLAINNLVKHKIICKKGNVYKLNVNKQIVQKVCDKIGFNKVYQ